MREPILLPLFAAVGVSFLVKAVSGLAGNDAAALKHLGDALGGVLSSEARASLGKLLARYTDASLDPATGLPRNHDLLQASRDALRRACTVLLLEQAGRLDPRKPWLPAILDHVRAGKLGKIPLIQARADPHRQWLETLQEALVSDRFERWHDQLVLNEQEIRECFRGGQCRLRGVLAKHFLEWAELETQKHTAPEGFTDLVEHGWSVKPGAPATTLDHAYCLFVREHLKQRPDVFRIYVADTMGDILAAQQELASATDFSAFQEWLAPQLGGLMGLAAGLNAQVRAVVEGEETLWADVGEIKVALLVLNTEVERGNQAASEVLNTLRRLERRLDFAIAGLSVQRFGIPDPPNEGLDLLKAKHQAAGLVAGERDLTSLWRWVEGEERISARLIVGRAGTGKTRLAFEFLLQIAERLPNWEAGLLTGTVLRKFDATKQPSDWRWSAPTLLVVDYAQPLAAPLGELLRALTHKRRQADLPPLRLLLLERAPGGWFEDLLNQEDSGGPCAVRKLFDPPEPVELTPIPTGQLRLAVLTQVLEKAAVLAGRPPTPLPAEGDATFAKSLNRDLFAEPLNLYMAALAATDLGLNAALNRSRPDLALVLARKELDRICRFARQAGNDAQETLLCHLAACATVERGFTEDECRRAVAEEYEVLGRSWPDGVGDLQEVLQRALPGERLPVASIEPDFIGEAVVLKTLAKPAPGASAQRWTRWSATIARCFQRDPFATASTVMNAFQNFGHLEGHGEARRPEALSPAEEAVKLYRALFEQNPDAFRPALAMSLNMMGRVREANRQADLALECFAEGVRVLAPQFMVLPTAFAQLMARLRREYLRLAETLGQEPDASLLTPVAEVLQRLQSGAPPGKEAPPDS